MNQNQRNHSITLTYADLQGWAQEYFRELDNLDKESWYATARIFADGEVGRFFQWLEENKAVIEE